jgi:hypothetical protein
LASAFSLACVLIIKQGGESGIICQVNNYRHHLFLQLLAFFFFFFFRLFFLLLLFLLMRSGLCNTNSLMAIGWQACRDGWPYNTYLVV